MACFALFGDPTDCGGAPKESFGCSGVRGSDRPAEFNEERGDDDAPAIAGNDDDAGIAVALPLMLTLFFSFGEMDCGLWDGLEP